MIPPPSVREELVCTDLRCRILGERETSLLLRRSSQRKFRHEMKRDSGSARNRFPSRYKHYEWEAEGLIGAPSAATHCAL